MFSKKKKGLNFFSYPPDWYGYDYEGRVNFLGELTLIPRFSNSSLILPLVIFDPLRFQIPTYGSNRPHLRSAELDKNVRVFKTAFFKATYLNIRVLNEALIFNSYSYFEVLYQQKTIYFKLFDGPISIGKLQGKIDKTFSIVTQRNSLRIQFNSDNSVQKKGFQFRYKQGKTIN